MKGFSKVEKTYGELLFLMEWRTIFVMWTRVYVVMQKYDKIKENVFIIVIGSVHINGTYCI